VVVLVTAGMNEQSLTHALTPATQAMLATALPMLTAALVLTLEARTELMLTAEADIIVAGTAAEMIIHIVVIVLLVMLVLVKLGLSMVVVVAAVNMGEAVVDMGLDTVQGMGLR